MRSHFTAGSKECYPHSPPPHWKFSVRSFLFYLTSFSSNTSPHSGQNFGGCAGSAGSQPHLSQRYRGALAGFFAPQFEQNLPLLTFPQVQVQPSCAGSGFFAPHSGQNLPVAVAPQLHFQLSPAGLGSGFFAPHSGQNLPQTTAPQEHFHRSMPSKSRGCSTCCFCCCCCCPML